MATDPVDALPSFNRRDSHLRTACPADAWRPPSRASVRPSTLNAPASQAESKVTWIGLGGARPMVAPPAIPGVIDG
jgi:hypothetical protein